MEVEVKTEKKEKKREREREGALIELHWVEIEMSDMKFILTGLQFL